MRTLTPFANEADSLVIGGLTVENRTDRVALYGDLDLTRDKAGLAQARALKAVIDKLVKILEADKRLPEKVAPPPQPDRVKNPFR